MKKNIFVLPNLEKKIEESIHDSIAFFNKRCPYCDTNLYDNSVRNKIEIDHYIPISKGGQNVPWNVLAVCKTCNRKKGDKLPSEYLSPERKKICDDYLKNVRKRYVGNLQIDIEKYQLIKKYLSSILSLEVDFSRNELIDIINQISGIIGLKKRIGLKSKNKILNKQVARFFTELFENVPLNSKDPFFKMFSIGCFSYALLEKSKYKYLSRKEIYNFLSANLQNFTVTRKYINGKQHRVICFEVNELKKLLKIDY